MVNVLIVDDDMPIRNTLRVLLEEAGYHVTEADSGAHALALMRAAATPLVVLLDHIMAHVTGRDVLHTAAAEGLDVRHCCALMSASPHKLDTDQFIQHYRVDHDIAIIAKPFRIDRVLTVVAACAETISVAS